MLADKKMPQRESLSKSLRFEVFKRDSFTCQYCGRKSPDVLLEIDHIEPVSLGGTNDQLNLLTSCKDCNAGKSDRRLSDTSVVEKQRRQLEELQERKEQLEMMFEWQKGLLGLDDEVTGKLSEYWSEVVPGFHLTESGLKTLKNLRRRFEVGEILSAMKIASERYVVLKDGNPTNESVNNAWNKVGGICSNTRLQQTNPTEARLRRIRATLRNRLHYFNDSSGVQYLRDAVAAGACLERLETHAQQVRNWTQWRNEILDYTASLQESHDEE